MKVLVFDIWGDYGHFRKFYTTSSPLTFAFPPPPTLAGILGAVCGADKADYLKTFSSDRCRLGLRIMAPVSKVRMGINLINTKDGVWRLIRGKYHEPRTQIRTEFLKNPWFRIYMTHNDEDIFNSAYRFIGNHNCVFTVSLGLSELLAGYRFVGIYEARESRDAGIAEILTPVTTSNLVEEGIDVEPGKKYFKEKMPIKMNPKRVVEEYDDVIYESDGKTIKARMREYWTLDNGDAIAFF
ncbi:MAG: hypothetical protein A4E57_04389 [Syntrophorhabdaceae bacterium PtaU1.Bin034]|nr:MAG: hypothetical protein A4E57_04389 [Syntrophorhabdaceae bacterium PtaU1.Bin034]